MNKLATRIKNVGPGALVAAAFIGPGTVTSCSISGATAGYTLLWAMLLSVISVIIMQSTEREVYEPGSQDPDLHPRNRGGLYRQYRL